MKKTNIVVTEKFVSKTQNERTEAIKKILIHMFVRDILSGEGLQ